MRISDWSSDVCSSDLPRFVLGQGAALDHDLQPLEALCDHLGSYELLDALCGLGAGAGAVDEGVGTVVGGLGGHLQGALEVVVGLPREADDDVGGDREVIDVGAGGGEAGQVALRSEEHTSELQSLMRISYAV